MSALSVNALGSTTGMAVAMATGTATGTVTGQLRPAVGFGFDRVRDVRPAPQDPRGRHLRVATAADLAAVRDPSALRITRRGRLAATTTVALGLILTAMSLLDTFVPAGATSSVVVEPGMTLTEIAQDHLPGVPVSQAIVDIQRVNKLNTTSIAVGQELRLP